MGYDGTECVDSCPTICIPGEMTCKGGWDDNGCKIADTCMPQTGGEL